MAAAAAMLVVDDTPPTDLRVELAAAQEAAAAAHLAVEDWRARLRQARVPRDAAAAALKEAKERAASLEHVLATSRLTYAQINGYREALKEAETLVAKVAKQHDAAVAEHEGIKAEKAGLDEAAGYANDTIEMLISGIIAEEATRIVERLAEIAREAEPLRKKLTSVLRSNPHDVITDTLLGLRAVVPLDRVRARVRELRLFDTFRDHGVHHPIHRGGFEANTREALRRDAHAALE